MAEKLILVCDLDARPAVSQALVQMNGKRFVLDLCAAHAREFTSKGRPPRRGRKPAALAGGATSRKRVGAKTSTRKRATRKSVAKRKSTGKRRTSSKGRS